MTGLFPTLCAADVEAARDFYIRLFDFRVVFDSGWYVQIEAPSVSSAQIGIVERDHQSVPEQFRRDPAGMIISIEVDDVDAVHERVLQEGLAVPLPLRDEDFGQRHFMTVDPAGTLVDVITQIAPSSEYAAMYSEDRLPDG